MTQAGGHKKKRKVRSKFARKRRTKVKKFDWRTAQKGQFLQKTRRKHRKRGKQRENLRYQAGTYKKLCDRCQHRPNRRVKCRICQRSVGPCCLATEDPDPYCKDCWEPDPEQMRTQRDEVLQVEESTTKKEERQKEFACRMMESARRQRERQTSSMTSGTKEKNSFEEQAERDRSELKEEMSRRENSKRSRAPSPERWTRKIEPKEEGENSR